MQKVAPNDLTLISYGMCNLNCVYCTIDKNKYLKQVDDELKESFINYKEQYCDRIKKWFPEYSLNSVSTWGGEPLWDIERIFPLLEWIVENYPNFHSFFSSTNFSYSQWSDKIMNIIKFFGKYSQRTFDIEIQLSMDGPEYINDRNRGKGVTKRCVENLKKLREKLIEQGVPKNVTLYFHGKPTLSVKNIEEDLISKEKIIEYYQDLEKNCYDYLEDIDNERIKISYALPNVAAPASDTSYTGKCFANICKWCKEIEKEGLEKYFKYFKIICPFSQRIPGGEVSFSNSTRNCLYGCGTGVHGIMMMPDGYYITCHSAFGDVAEEYKKLAYNAENYTNKEINLSSYMNDTKLSYVLNEEEYEKFVEVMIAACSKECRTNGEFQKKTIQTLASCGQIDEKYKDSNKALAAINKLLFLFAGTCIYNSQAINNSVAIPYIEQYRLFLNGALDYIWQ